jgi:hypothetical protein
MKQSIIGVSLSLACLVATVGQGCRSSGVGDPCVPDSEFSPTFSGFNIKEVNVESKSFQCQTRICLVNHFRGRVSCGEDRPEKERGLGQDKNGLGPGGTSDNSKGCNVPGTKDPITGPVAPGTTDPADSKKGKCVQAWCEKRKPENAVYCSCRCADVNGNKEGSNFCTCPDGFACEQLVSSTGTGNEGLTGGYCIKQNTKYDPNADPCGASVPGGITACPD